MWHPERTDNYSRDVTHGRLLFAELISDMKKTGNPYMLQATIESQIAGGIFDGVEIGFASALTEKLLSGSSTASE